MKQVRNTIFASLSGAVVLMAFANNLHDFLGRWWPGSLANTPQGITETSSTAQAQTPSPPDTTLLRQLQALAGPPTLHVSTTGNDANPGTAAEPFQSLEQALQTVRTAQTDNPEAKFVIQLAAGTYGNESLSQVLVIPPGVTLKGQGQATRLVQMLHLNHQSRVEHLALENSGILIQPNDGSAGEITVEGLDIQRGFLAIKAPQAMPPGQIKVSQLTMADSCLLVSGVGRPELRDLQLRGNVGVDDFSLTHCSENGLVSGGNTMPLIQLLGVADLENIVITEANLAVYNQSEGSSIKNLKIFNSLSGVDNTGQLHLENLNLENISYTGICNQGSLTLQRPQFNPGNTSSGEHCLIPGLDQPPSQPLMLAGNLAAIQVN